MRVLIAIALLFAVYFPAAYWAIQTYVPDPNDPPPEAGIRIRILPSNYAQWPDAEFAAIARDIPGTFEDVGDDLASGNQSSPIQIYENGKKLGPAHSTLGDITTEGRGRFLHERGFGHGSRTAWSSSDNTNPKTNGRTYWIVKPN